LPLIAKRRIARLMICLGVRSATAQDRRAALLSAMEAAAMSDSGASIVNAIVATLRERGALLPAAEIIDPHKGSSALRSYRT
jgi:hypothetical protein